MKKFTFIPLVFILMTFLATTTFAGNPWRQMKKVEKSIVAPKFPKRYFVVTDYYNGTDSLFTDAINEAIADCSMKGGGYVIVPNGTFHTAAIHMRSNVNLHLNDEARLIFTTDYRLYKPVITRIEGIDCYNLSPLIYAYGAENIAVTGKGVLDGQSTFSTWLEENRLWKVQLPDGTIGNEKSLLNKALEEQWPIENFTPPARFRSDSQFAGRLKSDISISVSTVVIPKIRSIK